MKISFKNTPFMVCFIGRDAKWEGKPSKQDPDDIKSERSLGKLWHGMAFLIATVFGNHGHRWVLKRRGERGFPESQISLTKTITHQSLYLHKNHQKEMRSSWTKFHLDFLSRGFGVRVGSVLQGSDPREGRRGKRGGLSFKLPNSLYPQITEL